MICQRTEKRWMAGPIQKPRYSHLCSLCCFTTKLHNSGPEGAGPDMRVKRILMRVITVVDTAGFSTANLHTNLITAGTVLSTLHKLTTYPCHRLGKKIPYYFIYQWAHWGTDRLSNLSGATQFSRTRAGLNTRVLAPGLYLTNAPWRRKWNPDFLSTTRRKEREKIKE